MKMAISVIIGFVLGGSAIYLVMRPHQPWALATSGSGSPGGVSIRGIFGTEDGCLMFRKSYLGRRKVASEIASENKETKAELYEEAGILLTSDGRWYTARCLLLSTLPSPSSDLSGIEDALREIAHSVIR